MSDYDRFANARVGAGLDRSRAGAVDEGLRTYMLGVYNYMTLGLGVTGLVAWAAYVLPTCISWGAMPYPPARSVRRSTFRP